MRIRSRNGFVTFCAVREEVKTAELMCKRTTARGGGGVVASVPGVQERERDVFEAPHECVFVRSVCLGSHVPIACVWRGVKNCTLYTLAHTHTCTRNTRINSQLMICKSRGGRQ